jgi:hypothetical protein
MTFVLSIVGYVTSLFMVTAMVFAAVIWAFPAPGASDHRASVDISAQHHARALHTLTEAYPALTK